MVSPEISEEDQDAIRRGVRDAKTVLRESMDTLFENARLSESAIERHAVETLAFLVASGRLDMRVVLMTLGMYHKKIWLFRSTDQWLAVHGSGNATERGLLVNGEQMSIDRQWIDGPRSVERVNMFLAQWSKRWDNQDTESLTVDVGQSLQVLRGHARLTPPTIDDFWESWRQDHDAGFEPDLPHGYTAEPISHRLRVPDCLSGGRVRSHTRDLLSMLLLNEVEAFCRSRPGAARRKPRSSPQRRSNATAMDIFAS